MPQQTTNLFNIKLYGREWEPDYFRHKGLRGWWLRTLNHVRFWLELKVQWHTLYILSRIVGADIDSIRQQFEADTAKQVDTWREERGAFLLSRALPEELTTELYRSKDESPSPEQRTLEMLARLTELQRARRYRTGPRSFKVFEVPDEDHLPHVNKRTGTGTVAASAEVGAPEGGTDAATDEGTRRPSGNQGSTERSRTGSATH